MKLRLSRFDDYKVTCGALSLGSKVICFTLELPWRDNKKNSSCIPLGTYDVVPHVSPKFGKTLLLLDVPDRSEILIHAGNTAKDTRGCILVGEGLDLSGALTKSKKALSDLLSLVEGCPLQIEIVEAL
jgi:hypothetical protein